MFFYSPLKCLEFVSASSDKDETVIVISGHRSTDIDHSTAYEVNDTVGKSHLYVNGIVTAKRDQTHGFQVYSKRYLGPLQLSYTLETRQSIRGVAMAWIFNYAYISTINDPFSAISYKNQMLHMQSIALGEAWSVMCIYIYICAIMVWE